MPRPPTWKNLAVLGVSAAVAFVAVDLALGRVTPPHAQREVEDAVADWRAGAPQVLFVGSSHGRTFDAVGQRLAELSQDRFESLAVPVEFGKWSSYRWVLDERIWPALEDDAARREQLRHLVLVTEWWDSTAAPGGGAADNLPSRAWEFGDFAADALDSGLTPYNQNYLQERFRRLFRWSTLVADRGHDQILRDLKDLVRPRPEAEDARNHALQVEGWRRTIETGIERIFDPYEAAAMEAILRRAAGFGLEVTIVLYPRMPVTVTAAATAPGGTLHEFATRMRGLAAAHGARFVDATTGAPIDDGHFARDFDHVTDAGNELLAAWFLEGGLRFLADEARAAAEAGR